MQRVSQVRFEFKTRVRKPTQSEGDCAQRLTFMLNVCPFWFEAVHGFIDQGDFPIPLSQRVRAGGGRHSHGGRGRAECTRA